MRRHVNSIGMLLLMLFSKSVAHTLSFRRFQTAEAQLLKKMCNASSGTHRSGEGPGLQGCSEADVDAKGFSGSPD